MASLDIGQVRCRDCGHVGGAGLIHPQDLARRADLATDGFRIDRLGMGGQRRGSNEIGGRFRPPILPR
jgi:hypothetical protein